MMRAWICPLLIASTASAYVRSRTPHGTEIRWPATFVYIQPDSAASPDVPPDTVFTAVQTSEMDWRNAAQGCSYMQLQYDQPAPLEAHYDAVNTVKFRTDRWCHPDDAQDNNNCYDKSAAAITTVFYNDRPGQPDDGEIIDADIEMNDINFTFTVITGGVPRVPRPGTSIADLENTLTHEMGHLQGLDHTCKDSATSPQARDDMGNVPPACDMLNLLSLEERLKITEATMYNVATPGEIKKRSPEADDVNGICEAYPTAQDPRVYDHAKIPVYGCSATGNVSLETFVCLLVILTAGRILRRRRA
jgi:hypothetical protein